MITYFIMKHKEWKVKKYIYGLILDYFNSKSDITALTKRLYIALKDTPVDELQQKLVEQVAELAQEQGK